jgi:hypothetical protein
MQAVNWRIIAELLEIEAAHTEALAGLTVGLKARLVRPAKEHMG